MAEISDFRNEFPEFASVDDATITRLLNRASGLHNATTRGTLYAAAHLHTLDQEKTTDLSPDGGAGVVAMESIGSRSVTYSNMNQGGKGSDFWKRSPYGREFLQIEMRNPIQGVGIVIA